MAEPIKKQYRKISKIGNSLGINIPKEIVKQLDIQHGETWEVSVENNQIIIKPMDRSDITIRPEVLKAFNKAVTQYNQVFKNLRDR